MARKNWYSMQVTMLNEQPVAEIRIYDEIGFWGITAAQFAAQMDAIIAQAGLTARVLVAINSPGGNTFDAFAIYNMLRRYAGRVDGRVDGVAASAASLVLMGCDRIIMPENAQLMLHEPETVAWGRMDDLRAALSLMENTYASVVAAYATRSGQTPEKIMEMMQEITWLDALEAQALGLCDVIEEPVSMQMSANAAALLSGCPNLPEGLRSLIGTQVPEMAANPITRTLLDDANLVAAGGAAPAAATPPASAPTAPAASVPAESTMDAAALVAHVYMSCRQARIPHLAESVLCSGAMRGREQADERIAVAGQIAGLCMAAKLPDMAADIVSAGLGVEQARARLFDAVTQNSAQVISNMQPSQAAADPRISSRAVDPVSIYAARRAHS